VLPLASGVDLAAWLAGFEGESLALALGEDNSLYARPLAGPLALIVGNEGAGLSKSVREAARAAVRIPMPGKIESLNAAAALAVAVFEAARQRAA
jgi:TrmH family RNA methyltransferase